MSQLPTFGLVYNRVSDRPIPVLGSNLDVVGIVGPCSTANPTVFPPNTPVLVFSNDHTKLAKLGADGYIVDAINAINDQLADFEVAAQLVIVVTPYGTASDFNLKQQQTIANVMGDSVAGTGVWALLKAPNILYCTPRIILCPGYTGQMANSLDTLDVNTPGVGYVPGRQYQVSFAAGGGETHGATLVMPIAHAVAKPDTTIDTEDITITSFGAWMSTAPVATLPAPDGTAPTAQPAAGFVIFQRTPGVGSSITFNGTQVQFVSGTPSGNQVQIDAGNNLGTTLANLLAFLQASADAQISANTYVITGGTLTMTQKATGTAGNGFTLASNVTGASLSGPHLTGGTDGGVLTQATLTAAIALGANPVCATLGGGVLDGLIGNAWVESAGTSYIDDLNWRDTLNSQRLIPMTGGVKVLDAAGDIVVMPAAPRIAGLQIATDFSTGFPFHSAANRAVNGIVGPARNISFSLTDGATEGQQLLAANMGVIVRGNVGVENAISSGGFVYIGTDNAGDDPEWQFYNVVRGRDYIELSLMPAMRVYLGRTNIDAPTVMHLLDTIGSFLSTLQAFNQILGWRVEFLGSLNNAQEIRAGHLTVGFAAEEPPVLRRITTQSARYAPAIDVMVAQLEQQLQLAA